MKNIAIGILVLLLLGSGGYWFLSSPGSTGGKAGDDYEKAQVLLEESKGKEALAVITKYSRLPEGDRGTEFDWTELEVQAVIQMESIPRIIYLFKKSPEAFDKHEKTILMLGRMYLQYRQEQEFNDLRSHWRGKEENELAWFLLDADHLMFGGKLEEATALLSSKSFEKSEDEITRLLRLALITSRSNLKTAWSYLSAAYRLNPKSTEVRSFRAQILESINQLPLARVEYMAAFVADPENARTRDQLAEFYRRHKQYPLALQTWAQGLTKFSADYIWAKAVFWNRVVLPLKFEWENHEVPEGNLEPFVNYLLDLEKGEYWNEETFRVLPETRFYITTRQETFWMRLLHELSNGRETEALEMIENNPFSQVSWDDKLENALRQVLTYRQTGVLPLAVGAKNGAPKAQIQNSSSSENPFGQTTQQHQFIETLEKLAATDGDLDDKMPLGLKELLLGDDAIAATFLAAGWIEVALDLQSMPVYPKSYPQWASYGFSQAMRLAKGNEAALTFANAQYPTPVLSLLKGDMMVATGDEEGGLKALSTLTSDSTGVGFRAAWILASHHTEKKQYDKARNSIKSHKTLSKHVVGQELLARMALEEGNTKEAERIYTDLKEKSFLAKSYFAKQAFEQKDYATAKTLTQELITRYPDVLRLRANLKAIIDAEKAAVDGQTSSQLESVVNERAAHEAQ